MKRLSLIRFSVLTVFLFFATSLLADLILSEGGPSGQWFNPERDGEGFYVEVIEASPMQFGVAMYSYDADGVPLWVVGTVGIDDDAEMAVVPVAEFDGPSWGSGYDEADLNPMPFGTITVQFPTCDTALFSVKPDGPLENFSYSLVRLTTVEQVVCTDPPEPPTGITPGHWSGPGVCFMVSDDGTRIEGGNLSECDAQNAFDSNLEGLTNGLDECNVNAGCEGVHQIVDGKFSCVNEAGELAIGTFNSTTGASGYAYEDAAGQGEYCTATWTATPD